MVRVRRRTLSAAALFPFLGFPISGTRAERTGSLDEARRLLQQGDPKAAREILEPLAAAGNPAATTELAILHYFGRGTAIDEERAHALFKRAADGNDAAAMFWLGRMALLGDGPEGRGTDADRSAARWFFEAARRGHADAQYHLGLLLLAGTGVYADRDEAMKWIGRAAAAGHPAARQFNTPDTGAAPR